MIYVPPEVDAATSPRSLELVEAPRGQHEAPARSVSLQPVGQHGFASTMVEGLEQLTLWRRHTP